MRGKTVYLKSFGCQMNSADSEQFLGILGRAGYKPTDRPEGADLILLNTCAIRAKAEQKVFSELGRLREYKLRDPSVKIGVAGCVAQSLGKGILSREPAVDFVLGTRSAADLPDMIRQAETGRRGVSLSATGEFDLDTARLESVRTSPYHAYVPIIYGCDNHCAYCVVPGVRGPERSRPDEGILREIRDLAQRGYRAVTLLGQNVNSYGKKDNKNMGFSELLHAVCEVSGIDRVRFVTSHPRDLSEDVVNAMGVLPPVCEALHLPVQSGSDRILAAMNRGYTRAQYFERIALLRDRIPGIALSTDIIVGFPGESDADFAQTLSLIAEVAFDSLFGFAFSPRPETPAAGLPGRVEAQISQRRLHAVLDLQREISARRNAVLVGASVEVLVEGRNPRNPQGLSGRTRTHKIVHFQGDAALTGTLVAVRITEARPNCLIGVQVDACRPGDGFGA